MKAQSRDQGQSKGQAKKKFKYLPNFVDDFKLSSM